MAKTISTIAERNIAAEDGIINLKVKVKVGKFLFSTRNSYNSITGQLDDPARRCRRATCNDNVHFSARYYALALGKVGGDHVVGIIGG